MNNLTANLRQMITIEQPKLQNDGVGGQLEQWKVFAKVRAEVKALYEQGVGEVFASMQMMDVSLYRFRIRYIKGLKNNMRVLYNGRYFQIKRVINQNELNVMSILIAQETI